ncbi:FAD/NAD(P)-binding protein [Pseudoxanthomonas yeongjuensis]|uniref:FAD/NAD(P)-binding protein n=1 Tax=Pseudoxanthomonas yeongjuensis TaxID=377616 RepID=UPI00139135D4|nr:FAD/NAD(P)-binding protein [Pseudoxanthomonas yeongjuensis]
MRITIIGAGFSGNTLATLLASESETATEVCLVGVDETFGRGVAYGETRPEHLLNVRAGHLGADPDNAGEFADWLHLGPQGRNGFLPRLAYGEYLTDRLHKAKAHATNLTLLRQEAIAVDRIGDGFRVHLDDGSYFASDRVVLALGALAPQRLAGVGPRLAQSQRYVAWPWQDNALDKIQPDARVLIVGTGLTMADVVMSLSKRGHTGGIVAISRHGLVPQSHQPEPGPAIELPPSLQQALRTYSIRQLVAAIRPLARVIPDWRSAIDALRPHLQDFWRGLPARDRARFLRHVRSYWEVVRHRVAPEVGAVLDDLRASGQLDMRAGRLVRAGLRTDGAHVLIRERGSEQIGVERFDYVIRATGLDTDIAQTTHPLASHLHEAGLISADAHGLGVNVSDSLEVLDSRGAPIAGLYCLGPLLRGHLWEITAVPELRTAAKKLSQQLGLAGSNATAQGRRRNLERELALSQSF